MAGAPSAAPPRGHAQPSALVQVTGRLCYYRSELQKALFNYFLLFLAILFFRIS